ncbi:hypothetical protein HAX54_024248 [Datura stramonium]|uniref:Uncharacterized protein n=1 Tax=Datura stramonium TaxID=4076 RepID=A0ABS8UXM5_DATST|nr:hypothetical protein [Datura stramonium]
MTPKVNKGKGVASSSHGSKRARRPNEEEHEDMSMAPQPLRRYGLRWQRMNGVIEEKLQQLNIDYPLSEHSRALCRVGPGYEEPLDVDVATEDEMARVDSDIESSDDDEKDFEMGESALAPIYDEE